MPELPGRQLACAAVDGGMRTVRLPADVASRDRQRRDAHWEASMSIYPQLPWTADPADTDQEMFRVIRGRDGRPILYIAKELGAMSQEDVARLVTAAPAMLAALRLLFFATPAMNGGINWDAKQWMEWRKRVGPLLAELWPVERKDLENVAP